MYDPFAKSNNANSTRKLVRAQWPDLFNKELRNLEWKDERRKRPRSENANASEGERQSPPKLARQAPTPNLSQPSVAPEETMTILGVPPLVDDRVRSVTRFILEHVQSPDVEVEAKLGMLMEKPSGNRAVLLVPVTCETPLQLASNRDTRFVSDVGVHVFQRLNGLLNERVIATESSPPSKQVIYTRNIEVDLMYPGRIRESRRWNQEKNTYVTYRVQEKLRLADLNVLCPGAPLDARYSASTERPAEIPPGSQPDITREKDRISFKFEHISVDMTSVRTNEGNQQKSSYEVEVEIADSKKLFQQANLFREGDASNKLFEIVAQLVNTVRLLLEEIHNFQASNPNIDQQQQPQ